MMHRKPSDQRMAIAVISNMGREPTRQQTHNKGAACASHYSGILPGLRWSRKDADQ